MQRSFVECLRPRFWAKYVTHDEDNLQTLSHMSWGPDPCPIFATRPKIEGCGPPDVPRGCFFRLLIHFYVHKFLLGANYVCLRCAFESVGIHGLINKKHAKKAISKSVWGPRALLIASNFQKWVWTWAPGCAWQGLKVTFVMCHVLKSKIRSEAFDKWQRHFLPCDWLLKSTSS